MGACDISFELKGKATMKEIDAAFKAQREKDSHYNGHQEGYSGDFQTVNKVEFHTHTICNTHNEAFEYCLSKAEKWTSVVAVYYKNVKLVDSKTLTKLKVKKTKISEELNAMLQIKPKGKFKKCGNCKSKVSMQYFQYSDCPICKKESFLPAGLLNRIKKKEIQVNELKEKIKALETKEYTKLAEKCKDVNTLVAGWGAC